MPKRSYLPPETCSACGGEPLLGATLLSVGGVWLCPACFSETLGEGDLSSKTAGLSLAHERSRSMAMQLRQAGQNDDAAYYDGTARSLRHQMSELQHHGQITSSDVSIQQGEAATGLLKDTLANPDLVAIESSHARGQMLAENGIVALGIDVSNTAGASNTHEKLIAHEIALAHKIAMEQAQLASFDADPAVAVKRLNLVARMMTTAQEGMLNLQKLRSSGPQKVLVQHVTVEAGGQAVVGNVGLDTRRG